MDVMLFTGAWLSSSLLGGSSLISHAMEVVQATPHYELETCTSVKSYIINLGKSLRSSSQLVHVNGCIQLSEVKLTMSQEASEVIANWASMFKRL
jgi:hypothetical protein